MLNFYKSIFLNVFEEKMYLLIKTVSIKFYGKRLSYIFIYN